MLRQFIAMLFTACLITNPAAATGVRQIAITFDDAPTGKGPLFSGEERTRRLLQALEDAEIKGAMFFVITQNIDRAEHGRDRLKAYVQAGNRLANHSHSHSWLWKNNATDYSNDIASAAGILKQFDGVSPFYRFPYLDEGRSQEKRDAVRKWLRENSLLNGYVTVDNYDWYMNALFAEAVRVGGPIDHEAWRDAYVDILMRGVEFYDELARETLGRSPRHVLLLHENDLAAMFVDDLAEALRRNGWEIIPAEEAYYDPIAQTEPATTLNGQGRAAAIAHSAGAREAHELVSRYESEDWLRYEFATRGLLSIGSGG